MSLPSPASDQLCMPFRTLVVNTVGEPGCGKTTLSFWLCQALKHEGVVVEFVPEVVKYECFAHDGRIRVASGDYDNRYLTLQRSLFNAVCGHVQVLINDGAFEMFPFYARRRMSSDKFAHFLSTVNALVAHKNTLSDQLFVAPVRSHAYEQHGRLESDEQAQNLRVDMLSFLHDHFAIDVQHIGDVTSRQMLLENILSHLGR